MKSAALLRVGLAFVFFYAGISSLLDPTAWMGYLPVFLQDILEPRLLITIHGVLDIILGLWLLSGYGTFYAALATSLFFLGLISFNLGAFVLVFRDVGLLFAALALMQESRFSHYENT